MKTVLLLLALFPLMARSQDDIKEPFSLPNGEWVFSAVEERDGAKYRLFYLITADGEKVPVWSRRQTEEPHWSDELHLRGFHAADRQGDHLGTVIDYFPTPVETFILRINLATGEVMGTRCFKDGPFPGLRFRQNEFKVTGPDTVTVGHGEITRVMEWRANGEVYVDGIDIGASTPPDNGTGFKLASVSGAIPPASPETPLPAAATGPVSTAPALSLLRPQARGQQTNDDNASGWLLATVLLVLLGGVLLFWRMKSRS